jgi:hypothetical protein
MSAKAEETLASLKDALSTSLPKLAECPCFEEKPGEADPAAALGTLLDPAMRNLLAGGGKPAVVTGEDAAAVGWAVAAVEEMVDGAKISSADADCRVTTPGMEHLGTADAIIPERLLVVDLKSGKVRNYWEGACQVKSSGKVVGSAHVELTGYAGSLNRVLMYAEHQGTGTRGAKEKPQLSNPRTLPYQYIYL